MNWEVAFTAFVWISASAVACYALMTLVEGPIPHGRKGRLGIAWRVAYLLIWMSLFIGWNAADSQTVSTNLPLCEEQVEQ